MISIINHLEYPVYPKSVMRIIITFHQKDIFRLRFNPGYETRVRISPDCPPHITILNCSDHQTNTFASGYSLEFHHVTLISSSSSFSVCSSGRCGLVKGLTSLKSNRGLSPSASLKSGLGLFLFGNVCSREPPVASNSLSLLFLHFIRRFWNQIFTWTHTIRYVFILCDVI